MWNEIQSSAIDLSCSIIILVCMSMRKYVYVKSTHFYVYFLEKRIINPKEYVAPPVTFLLPWWDMGNCAFIYFPYSPYRGILFFLSSTFFSQRLERTLLQMCIVEPHIIISTIMCNFILVLDTALPKDRRFDY